MWSCTLPQLAFLMPRLRSSLAPPQARFAADQNLVPHGEGPKLPFPSLEHLGPLDGGPSAPPQQPQRQGSIVDLAQWGDAQGDQEMASLYHQTNLMLRDLHLERMRRLGHAPS